MLDINFNICLLNCEIKSQLLLIFRDLYFFGKPRAKDKNRGGDLKN